MRKGFSLGFNTGYSNDLNSYTKTFVAPSNPNSNRNIVVNGNNQWVKFFVDWTYFQPTTRPTNIIDSWNQLRDATHVDWSNLDASIKAANNDGRGVILSACSRTSRRGQTRRSTRRPAP